MDDLTTRTPQQPTVTDGSGDDARPDPVDTTFEASSGPVTATVDGDGRLVSLRIELPGFAGAGVAASVLAAVRVAQDRAHIN